MTRLLKRYWLAFVLRLGALGGWIDGVCSDYALARSSRFTFAQVRRARALDLDLTDESEARQFELRTRGRP